MEYDFTQDREDWHGRFSDIQRTAALWNYSLFFHGEDSVTDNLSPLIDAAQMGFTDGATLLIEERAGINIANARGETPLIAAVQARDVTMARLLLANGADAAQSDHVAGLSARDYAARDSRATAILKLIDETPPVKHKPMMGPTR